jgi:hypothetical protein
MKVKCRMRLSMFDESNLQKYMPVILWICLSVALGSAEVHEGGEEPAINSGESSDSNLKLLLLRAPSALEPDSSTAHH